MDTKNWNLWSNITFKTQSYRKNFDLINDNENIITEHDGVISEVRIEQQLPPYIIGEYGFSVWNIGLGKEFNVDFNKLIGEHYIENTYSELTNVIKNNKFDINKYKKLVLVHNLVIHKDYRKHEITEEFIEMLYWDYYGDDVAIIALIKPFQYNPVDADFYLNVMTVKVRGRLRSADFISVPAIDYYSLKELMENTDAELLEYKLFSVASKCGFTRIGDSFLFILNSENIVERMKEKHEALKQNK